MDNGLPEEILDEIPDAIFAVSPEGRVIYWNAGAAAVYGYSRAEALGLPVQELLTGPPTSWDCRTDAMQGSMRRRKDGGSVRVVGRGRIVRAAGGEVRFLLRCERPASLPEGTGRQQCEPAPVTAPGREASPLRTDFFAHMSHELRTPLNGIIGFSEFLIDGHPGPLNVKQRDYLGDILESGRQLLELINDVLDLSRIDAGRMDLNPETFSLHAAVDEVFCEVTPLARKKNLAMHREIPDSQAAVTLDRPKFILVLHNLLSSAVKFTRGGGMVRLLAHADAKRGTTLMVGIGADMNAADLDRLFSGNQPFEAGSLHASCVTRLGLSLTKRVVELQGGRIEVESRIGYGSTFTVRLPVQPLTQALAH